MVTATAPQILLQAGGNILLRKLRLTQGLLTQLLKKWFVWLYEP